MQSFIVWMMAGTAEGDGAQGDEALEGTEGNSDNFGIFRCAAHEDGMKEVYCMPVICKSDSGIARRQSSLDRNTHNYQWSKGNQNAHPLARLALPLRVTDPPSITPHKIILPVPALFLL
jgi:hypothetical protein